MCYYVKAHGKQNVFLYKLANSGASNDIYRKPICSLNVAHCSLNVWLVNKRSFMGKYSQISERCIYFP